MKILSESALSRALSLRDLTDPSQGPHAVQQVLAAAQAALERAWAPEVREERRSPIVSVTDNYDALHYPPGGASRDARYTRHVSAGTVLRTQTSAMIPPALRELAARGQAKDVLLVCPGLVYRRDILDRLHVGEPHQVDLWRIRREGPKLVVRDLAEMITRVADAVAPGRPVRVLPTDHPYTVEGRQVDVKVAGGWIEIGECGLALPELLRENGLPESASGLAMGLGLDRLVMIAKGLDDIRLLRHPDPRIAAQMADLGPWRPVSNRPPIRRDLSLAVAGDADAEALGDRVREVLAERAQDVEAVEVLSETPGEKLPEAARARLGLRDGQKNVLLRVVLRAHDRTLTDDEANRLRDEVYAALHEGTEWMWAAGPAVPVVG
ncbi:MAG: hypothetical protein U0229_04140 [Anaeromyxobacter sp.]